MGGIFGGELGVVVGVVLLVGIPLGEPTALPQGNILGGNVNNNQQGTGGGLFGGALNRQGVGGISFIIPGLSLLQGNQNQGNQGSNNNGVGVGGGNLFGTVTFTRTLVSTVATVTTVSYRTCTTSASALSACQPGPAGRRRRDVTDAVQDIQIQPTPAITLSIDSTTIRDREAVLEYLEAHKPSSQSVIYPKDYEPLPNDKLKINPRLENEVTTILYPSQDTPEENEDDLQLGTTERVEFLDEISDSSTYLPPTNDEEDIQVDKARRGLARTVTVTTVIRVTSVATTLATGGSTATLSITYGGCSPQSFPVSGMACTM